MNKKSIITKSKVTIIAIVLIIMLDQISKFIVIQAIQNEENSESIEIINGVLNFTYVENLDGKFGWISNNISFFLLNVMIILILIRFLIVQKERIENGTRIALIFIIGGSISNLLDKIFRGSVVEFIDFSPLINFLKFNVAEIFIIIGWILFAFFVAKLTSEEFKERKEQLERSKENTKQ